MNEQKRRGRPPKALPEWPAEADKAIARAYGVPVDAAQAYAKRVWDGQSTDLPRKERLERVAKALEGQGLSMEGVSL